MTQLLARSMEFGLGSTIRSMMNFSASTPAETYSPEETLLMTNRAVHRFDSLVADILNVVSDSDVAMEGTGEGQMGQFGRILKNFSISLHCSSTAALKAVSFEKLTPQINNLVNHTEENVGLCSAVVERVRAEGWKGLLEHELVSSLSHGHDGFSEVLVYSAIAESIAGGMIVSFTCKTNQRWLFDACFANVYQCGFNGPWSSKAGDNVTLFSLLSARVLAVLAHRPGCTADTLQAELRVLDLNQTKNLLVILEERGIIKSKSTENLVYFEDIFQPYRSQSSSVEIKHYFHCPLF